MTKLMEGRKGLVMGVANDKSIAWSIAKNLHEQGAEVALTYQGDVLEKRVRKLAQEINPAPVYECDVTNEDHVKDLMTKIQNDFGRLDFLVHAIAFSSRDELQGRFVDTSKDNFLRTMEISVYSFISVVKHAEALLKASSDSSVLTLTYLGSQIVIPNYNVMGVAKAALEAATRYMAVDLGKDGIRVNAISAGPIRTLAASGIRDMRLLLGWAEQQSALRRGTLQDDVGKSALYILSSLASGVTGETHYVDCGFNINGMVPLDSIPRAAQILQNYSDAKKS